MWFVFLSHLALAGPLDGTYSAVLSESEVEGEIDDAIEKGVSQFSFAIRWIARSKLQSARTWCKTYTIVRDGTDWSHKCDDNEPTTAVIGGPSKMVKNAAGEDIELTVTEESGNVVVYWGGADGGRKQTYKWQPDGGFILDIEIVSDQLDPNITWAIKYGK